MSPSRPILFILLPALLLAPMARADPSFPKDELYLSLGPLLSMTTRSGDQQAGYGAELTLNYVDGLGAIGVFAQAQAMENDYTRLSGGVQATYVLAGLELGAMHETADDEHVASTGLHIAPYFTFIYGSIALRVGIPLSGTEETGPDGRTRRGTEVGLVFTAKLPFEVGHGGIRPLPGKFQARTSRRLSRRSSP